MKYFLLLFFTLSGICAVTAQRSELIPALENTDRLPPLPALALEQKLADLKPEIALYPNPAHNKTALKVLGFKPGYVQVQLIDRDGIVFRNDKRLLYDGNEIITLMFDVKPGIYMVVCKQNAIVVKNRLLVK